MMLRPQNYSWQKEDASCRYVVANNEFPVISRTTADTVGRSTTGIDLIPKRISSLQRRGRGRRENDDEP